MSASSTGSSSGSSSSSSEKGRSSRYQYVLRRRKELWRSSLGTDWGVRVESPWMEDEENDAVDGGFAAISGVKYFPSLTEEE